MIPNSQTLFSTGLVAFLALAGTSLASAESAAPAETPAIGTGPAVTLKLVAEGLDQPLAVTPLPKGGSLLIEQNGRIRWLNTEGAVTEDLVGDLRSRMSKLNTGAFDERGLLSLVLHPDFTRNRRIFVTYSAPLRAGAPEGFDNTLRLSEFKLTDGPVPKLELATEIVRLEIDKPFANHNGARLAFGPDGYLYMAVGDGGAANDEGKRPEGGNSQRLDTLMGKILRLDISTPSGHGIPKDNPFVKTPGALPEIWALGLRNAWGISFDRKGRHELFAADVGQNLFEEVNIIRKGGNYGWNLREGFHPFNSKAPNTIPAGDGALKSSRGETLLDPILEYRHPGAKSRPDTVGVSIVGGYVYRGRSIPALNGAYVFADWTRNWGLPQGTLLAGRPGAKGQARWTLERLPLADSTAMPGYFCALSEDRDGELYLMTAGTTGLNPGKGKLWKLVSAAAKR
jgi:glucose/arabinose dehydrogenase